MANYTINWNSVEGKVGKPLENKVRTAAVGLIPKVIGEKFVHIMDSVIANCAGISVNEANRIRQVPLVHTGSSVTGVHTNAELGVDYGIDLYFDFSGDMYLHSLSPRKYVHNLVALFNNGYPTNNIQPNKPIIGTWHGQTLILGPWQREGAHFVGKAIREFEVWAESQKIIVSSKVNPIYSSSTS